MFIAVLTFALITGRPSQKWLCGGRISQPSKDTANGGLYRPILLSLGCSCLRVSESTAVYFACLRSTLPYYVPLASATSLLMRKLWTNLRSFAVRSVLQARRLFACLSSSI